MNDTLFEIGAPPEIAERVVREIRADVERKTAAGAYNDARVARAERLNLAALRKDGLFLSFYLSCLRDAVYVDITDFEIHERRRGFSKALVALKRSIWKLLKFYTYRLWSQQNQVNGLIVTALAGLEEQYSERLRNLEARVQALENGGAEASKDGNSGA